MFESDDTAKGWDGNFNGIPMNSGVFLYYVRIEFSDGSKDEKKGNVMLLR